MTAFFDALLGLGDKLAAHILLSAAAILLGIAIALPLAIWAGRSATVARWTLGFASLVQTIPALALLALFFPLLLSLRAVFGEGLPALGFLPALLALALYALLPILRNAVTAQANLDLGVIEAADAMGMTPAQKLRLVEAPLAAPFVMAGTRTAAVWTIGAATLATTVGQPSLGDPIFAGLQTQNWALVLAGCIAAAGLALAVDGMLGLIERGMARRKRWQWLGGAGVVLAGVVLAAASYSGLRVEDDRRVVIGAKTFSEQFILARLIGLRLERAGYRVEYRDGLGSAVAHGAVASGQVDVLVDYTGTIWTNQMKRTDNPDRVRMLDEIVRWERATSGTLVLGRLGFENAYGLAMTRRGARGMTSIAQLAAVAPGLAIGGDPEFFERPEWRGVRDAYGLAFARQRNFAPTFLYDALQSGAADVISGYTSDGRIAADDLVILADPKRAFPNYDAIVLIGPTASRDAALVGALRPLIGRIDVTAMQAANYSVDRAEGKRTPAQAARTLDRRIR